MLAKTLVVYSMCSRLTYILCTLCVFSGYIYFNMSNKKLPYHTRSFLKHTDLNITEFLPKILLFPEDCTSSDLLQDPSDKKVNY